MPDYQPDKLVLLCHLLLPTDATLVAEVQLAIAKPEHYLATFDVNRGIREPEPDLPWIALLNGLRDREYLAEIDWKMPADEFFYGIGHIPALTCRSERFRWRVVTADGRPALLPDEPDRWADIMEGSWSDMIPREYLPLFGKWCESREIILAQFELNSDSHPLILAEVGLFPVVQNLATETGYGSLRRWLGAPA